ncbi:Regulator of nonsense transcripts upf2 [Asimina triloba]
MEHAEDECRVVGEHGKDEEVALQLLIGAFVIRKLFYEVHFDHVSKSNLENVARLEEFKKTFDAKIALRRSNLNPERPDSGFLRTLDSSIKRNTAVIKKLKQINEETRDGMMEELKSVNLSKFVSEAVTAICDAKLRASDIQAAVQCFQSIFEGSLMYRSKDPLYDKIGGSESGRYKDFSPSLIQGLLKVFFPGKSGDDPDADRSLKAMKKRSTLKLLVELFFVGVIEDASIFVNIIKDLTSIEHLKDRDTTQMNLSLLASFARQGRIFLGLPQSGQEINEEATTDLILLTKCSQKDSVSLFFKDIFYRGLNITGDQKKIIKKAIYSYYDASADLLQSEHTSLRQMEHENAKVLNAKGELSDENVNAYEKLRKAFDHLFRGVSSLAEALDMQPPVMPEDGHTRVNTGEDSSFSASGKESSTMEPIWDDEDTRAFYECLPDLRAFVPAVLLGEAEPKLNDQSAKAQEQQNSVHQSSGFEDAPNDLLPLEWRIGDAKTAESVPDQDHSQTVVHDNIEAPVDSESSQDGKTDEKGKDKEDKEKDKVNDSDKEKGKEKDTDKKGEAEKEKLKNLDGTNLDGLLQRLPGCVSRDLIDQLTVEFCYLNSKANRKKLVRTLFNVPRTSLELLPYYSRMVATLSTCMRDVSSMLLQMLEEEFNFLINKKDQMNIETKIRNIRFIGELCKFRIAPAGLVFSCLKREASGLFDNETH